MSVSTKSPLNIIGGNLFSGGPRTGEQQHVRGGSLRASFLSGALALNLNDAPGAIASGGHCLLWSGAGRLNSVFINDATGYTNSGIRGVFYNSQTVYGSGVGGSGAQILGVFNGPGGVSGQQFLPGQQQIFDVPFTSGLCDAAPSGVPAFTVTWTPEVVPSNPGVN